MKYQFFVNVESDEYGRNVGFSGYHQSHALQLAYSGEVESIDTAALERLFEQFNIDHPADYRNRSMSVGDVVVFDSTRAWSCEKWGWKAIPLPVDALFPADKLSRERLARALRVLIQTPHTLAYLLATDPKALAQAVTALEVSLEGNDLRLFRETYSRQVNDLRAGKPYVMPTPEGDRRVVPVSPADADRAEEWSIDAAMAERADKRGEFEAQ
jgi:hypothetical protein